MRRRQYASKPAQDTSVLSSEKLLQTRPFQPEIDNKLQAPSVQASIQPTTGGWDLTKMEFVDESPHTLTYGPPLQAKLTIGKPNDKYEQEADSVAKQVVQRLSFGREERPANGKATLTQPNQTLQRDGEPAISSSTGTIIQRKDIHVGIHKVGQKDRWDPEEQTLVTAGLRNCIAIAGRDDREKCGAALGHFDTSNCIIAKLGATEKIDKSVLEGWKKRLEEEIGNTFTETGNITWTIVLGPLWADSLPQWLQKEMEAQAEKMNTKGGQRVRAEPFKSEIVAEMKEKLESVFNTKVQATGTVVKFNTQTGNIEVSGNEENEEADTIKNWDRDWTTLGSDV